MKNEVLLMADSLEDKILRRIRGKPKGWVFTPFHFRDLGNDVGIRKALQTICDRGRIRRLSRGLYDNPKVHAKLGLLAPSVEQVVEAVCERNHNRYQPSGAYAANVLGLSKQVPARHVFLTDGPSRKIVVGKQTIELKHRAPSSMAGTGTITGLFIQALKFIGKKNFNSKHLAELRKNLDEKQLQTLVRDIELPPGWIADVIRQLRTDH